MLSRLKLENFRVFENILLHLDSDSVVFEGGNGQGKTSLLEAVFFTANLRSFRTLKINEMRKLGSPFFRISACIENSGKWKTVLGMEMGDSKFLRVDNVPVSKTSDFTGRIRTVAFLPDDPAIIGGSSLLRRRFFDMFISMMDKEYLTSLQNYSGALKSRNFILKSRNINRDILESYNAVLTARGAAIVASRLKYAELLSSAAKKVIDEIRPELSGFSIRMRYARETEDRELFRKKLSAELSRDILRGFTGAGPHLDDFDFSANGKSLRIYGSRGQLRIASFALKMAEFELIKNCIGQSPADRNTIVLVDDVLGDLDSGAKEAFFRKVSGVNQIFYTFTETPDDINREKARILRIENGTLV